MTHEFHPEAEQEFLDAVDFYESIEPGLGERFYLEVAMAAERVAAFPAAWPCFEGEIRRCLTHRFPFGPLYSVEPDAIFIVAVMHLHREPNYWKHRVQKH